MKNHLSLIFVFSLILFSCHPEEQMISNSKGAVKTKEQYDTFFSKLRDTLNIPGLSVAIINNSKIIYHNNVGDKIIDSKEVVNDSTYFEAASLSKPLFAFFVMKQVEKGIINLDKPLFQYLPYSDIEYDERYQRITARMILSHSSGFPNWRQDSLKIMFEPGTEYLYSGEGYKYLAQVIAKVNNVPFHKLDQIFQKEIAAQIGADRLYYQWNDDISKNKATGHIEDAPTHNKKDHKDNDFGAAGGLHTEAISYSKFLMSLFDHSILSEKATTELLKEQIQLPKDDVNSLLIGASGWSLGLGMIPTPNGVCYWHAGNNDDFQSWTHFYPSKKYGIVLFTNSDKVQNPVFFNMFFDFMDDGIKFDFDNLN